MFHISPFAYPYKFSTIFQEVKDIVCRKNGQTLQLT